MKSYYLVALPWGLFMLVLLNLNLNRFLTHKTSLMPPPWLLSLSGCMVIVLSHTRSQFGFTEVEYFQGILKMDSTQHKHAVFQQKIVTQKRGCEKDSKGSVSDDHVATMLLKDWDDT